MERIKTVGAYELTSSSSPGGPHDQTGLSLNTTYLYVRKLGALKWQLCNLRSMMKAVQAAENGDDEALGLVEIEPHDKSMKNPLKPIVLDIKTVGLRVSKEALREQFGDLFDVKGSGDE